MDMFIERKETKDWLEDFPYCHSALLSGYKESISDMTNSILTDPRSSRNTHIVNGDFERTPIYFMGFELIPEQSLFVLSCLYVFPGHRNKGYGRHLIDIAKRKVSNQMMAVQVAVEVEKLEKLSEFYTKLGFKTTNAVKTNFLGKSYVDYFWSAKNIKLTDIPIGTVIDPINKT